MRPIKCDYCGRDAELVGGKEVYPYRIDLVAKSFWKCAPCKAWVGCHPGTVQPLGRLADTKLRLLRSDVHAVFDPIWKSGQMTRNEAYAQLAKELGIASQNCHIGMFDIDTCRSALLAAKKIAQLDH